MRTGLFAVAFVLVGMTWSGVASPQDALSVKDDKIHLRLENDRVRVLERTLSPGEREIAHSHPAYLIHVLKGGRLRDHNANGKVTEMEVKDGDVLYVNPKTHWAENIGATVIHVVVIELKDPAP